MQFAVKMQKNYYKSASNVQKHKGKHKYNEERCELHRNKSNEIFRGENYT